MRPAEAASVMSPLRLRASSAVSCIGRGRAETQRALAERRSGLKPCDFQSIELTTCIGEVAGLDAVRVPPALARFECRNSRLAELALAQDGLMESVREAAGRYGPLRVGVFIGTSTSGILETEQAYRRRDPLSGALPAELDYAGTHNSFATVEYLRRRLALAGPAAAVSGACASSAKVFASAHRLIAAGLIDAALVGGVDSLCRTTLYGFNSLQLCSRTPCRPFDRLRDGISIGEAAAFALLERVPDSLDADEVLLLGVGESSDAYHMSAPQPEGRGARRAMEGALAAAGLAPEAIDYINLHGTATLSNDRAESQAVTSLFGPTTPCSSTKGATGHTLGAAGALEALICALALEEQLIPGGVHTQEVDATLTAHYLKENRRAPLRKALSNSFGFGGMNCSLVLGRAE
jgi:3-oxoacyl-[acyl-carrier-protein] synthase-1